MEGSGHSLAPQWLKSSGNDSRVGGINNQFVSSPYPAHITYSGRQWSSSSKGAGHSRSYSSSDRSWQDTDWEKDIDGNGPTSVSHDIPMTVGSSSKAMMMHQYNISTSTSSITLGTIGHSMAETLALGPPRSHSPQLSASSQKLEELALKQSRLLIPVTPSTPRSLVSSSSEKSKVKIGQQQYSFSHSRRPNHSFHSAHPNLDIQKISSSNSLNVSTSRELNGVSSAAKDNLSPNSRVVLSAVGATKPTSISSPSRSLGNNSTPSAWITLERRPTFPIQSRNDFFKNLSRKSSLEKPCSDVLPIDMSCASEKSEASTSNVSSCPIVESTDASLRDTSALNILTDYGSTTTENGNAASEPLKLSGSCEKQHSINPFPYPEEEEIAFLRSLGWEESTGDEYDEGLTEEEIHEFYEKYMKLKL